jgi:hypothetical protein
LNYWGFANLRSYLCHKGEAFRGECSLSWSMFRHL